MPISLDRARETFCCRYETQFASICMRHKILFAADMYATQDTVRCRCVWTQDTFCCRCLCDTRYFLLPMCMRHKTVLVERFRVSYYISFMYFFEIHYSNVQYWLETDKAIYIFMYMCVTCGIRIFIAINIGCTTFHFNVYNKCQVCIY